MPYAPGITYRGDQYTAEGLLGAGRAIAGLLTDYRRRTDQEQQEGAQYDSIFNAGLNAQDANGRPLVSEDEKQRYLNGDFNVRKGVAAAIADRVHQSWQEREAKMRWGSDPREGQPQAMVLPDGSVIPGRFYVPGAHTVIGLPQPEQPTQVPSPPKPTLGQEVIPGWIWNGNTLVPKERGGAKADDLSRFSELSRKSELDDLDRQIAAVRGEIAAGNTRPGPDWLPLTTPYADQLTKLQARRDSLASSSGQSLLGGGAPIETDPSTGVKFYQDPDGNRKPLPDHLQPSATPSPSVDADRFVTGKKYRDANGNIATYMGNGNWQGSSVPAPIPPGTVQTPSAIAPGDRQIPSLLPSAPMLTPQPGEVRRGFRFKGGDPADRNNWQQLSSQPPTPPLPPMTPQDMQALAWAQANPNDPRASAILQKLGM